MDKKIYCHLQHLQAFNNQRKAWLVLSTFVILAIGVIIEDWNQISQGRLLWIFASIGTLISVTWWYWTMKIIRQLIEHRQEESEILNDVIKCIRDIQKDVKNLPSRVDKDK